jgi:hypothetical protein
LLLTDDNLDKIEYQSLSCATTVQNDIEREGPYRRFFDTTGFWKKDTDAFINLTKNNVGWESRLLNFTNLSDKYVTIFAFKSQRTGFDVPLIDWYGAVEKVPPYVHPNDLASDYLGIYLLMQDLLNTSHQVVLEKNRLEISLMIEI